MSIDQPFPPAVPSIAGEPQVEISVEPGQPVVPPLHVRQELEGLLRRDTSAIGQVFNLLEEGKDAEQIRIAFGNQNTSFVWSYERMIKSLLDAIPFS